jgi:glycine cleavage system aminomethyltransferase T
MSAPVEAATLKRTPLYALHRELGAKLIDFGGWEMPVQYQGILEEHRAPGMATRRRRRRGRAS